MQKHHKKKTYRHLTRTDRDEIDILLAKGYAGVDIAHVLGVHKSTISREIAGRKRKEGTYDAEVAHQKAYVQRLHSKYQGMKVEGEPILKQRIIGMLKEHRSPDEIAGRMRKEGIYPKISRDAIYHWLYSVWGNQYTKYLCTKRTRTRKQKHKERREMIPERISVSARPFWGIHGEGDTFVSPRRACTPVSVAVVCEQDSKFLWGTKLPNRKPATMAKAIQTMSRELSLDTLTLDNGIENKRHQAFGIPSYFCDPQSPWQKPRVEQSIGLLRRWFIPKGTDLKTVSEKHLQECIAILNGKYRKSLGYQSSYEVARNSGILKKKNPAMMPVINNVQRVALEVRI